MLKFSLRRPADPPPHWGAEVLFTLQEAPATSQNILSFPPPRRVWKRRWGMFWRLCNESGPSACGIRLGMESGRPRIDVFFGRTGTPPSHPLKLGHQYQIIAGWDGATLYGLILDSADGTSERISCVLEEVPPPEVKTPSNGQFPTGRIEQVAIIYDKPLQRGVSL